MAVGMLSAGAGGGREGSQVPSTREPCREEQHRRSWLHPFPPLTCDLEIDPNRAGLEQDSLPALSNLGGGEGGETARHAG